MDLGEAAATDIFPVTIVNDAPELFPPGTTYVNWIARDPNGNNVTQVQKVLISKCTLTVDKDSFIQSGSPNDNEGGNPLLILQASGKNRVLTEFDLEEFHTDGFSKATLILTISETANNWGPNGRPVSAYPLSVFWEEGNGWHTGKHGKPDNGTGSGVTLNCAVDEDISNKKPDPGVLWNGGDFTDAAGPPVIHTREITGEVSWDVTQDLLNSLFYGWIIKKDSDSHQNGKIGYYSKEGAAAAGNMNLAPKLILEYE